MKRKSPRGLTAEIMLNEKRRPVTLTTGVLANRRPGCAGMVVGTDAGFIGKVDRGPLGPGLGFDRGIGFGFPLLDQFGILLSKSGTSGFWAEKPSSSLRG